MFRLLVEPFLKFLSKKCEAYYRGCRDTNTPIGVPEFVAAALPGTEKRPCLAMGASQKPCTAVDVSQPATKPATKQCASTAPTGSSRGEARCLSQPHTELSQIHTSPHLFVFIFLFD